MQNNNFIPFVLKYDVGGLTLVSTNGENIILKAGYAYQVCYTLQASTSTSFRYQIIPSIGGVANVLMPTSSNNIVFDQSAIGSVSSCFFVTANTDTTVGLKAYTNYTGYIDFIGTIFIHPIAEL